MPWIKDKNGKMIWIPSGGGTVDLSKVNEKIDELSEAIADLEDKVQTGGGAVASAVEPADDDMPKVFLTGDAFDDMTAEKN